MNNNDNNMHGSHEKRDGANGNYRATRPTRSSNTPPADRPRPAGTQNGRPEQRRLTNEERRRMEAARAAAMNSAHRMSSEEEYRRRRMEQQYLDNEQPRPASSNKRPAPAHTEESKKTSYRSKKKSFKINVGAVIFILVIAVVIGLSVHTIMNNIPEPPGGNENNDLPPYSENDPNQNENGENDSESTDSPADSDETETDPPEDDKILVCDTVIQLNKYIDVGYQILVNNNIGYARTDTVELTNIYSSRTGKLKVSGISDAMEEKAFRALEAMLVGLEAATGCDDLIITSGHRTVEYQQTLYTNSVARNGEEYTRRYTAQPGHSEHHTGLACDLAFFTDAGATIPIADHEFGEWLWDHCSDYGFLLRYPKNKENITLIAYEAWHFRYMGVPHAKATEYFGMCYEEYIDMIKDYTIDSKLLYVTPDGQVSDADPEALPTSNGYLVYYTPMTEGDSTVIKVPRGDAFADYEISGNNVDGFIVTINLK